MHSWKAKGTLFSYNRWCDNVLLALFLHSTLSPPFTNHPPTRKSSSHQPQVLMSPDHEIARRINPDKISLYPIPQILEPLVMHFVLYSGGYTNPNGLHCPCFLSPYLNSIEATSLLLHLLHLQGLYFISLFLQRRVGEEKHTTPNWLTKS